MKRSKRIATVTLGGAFVVLLAGCGEDTADLSVYKTVEECVAATNDKPLCEMEMTSARLNHEDSAPRFQDDKSCRQEFDNCVAVTGVDGGASWFMPAMTGFVLGRMIGQTTAQPVFYDRKGYAYVRNLPSGMRRDDDNTTYFGGSSRTSTTTASTGSSVAAASSSGGYSRVTSGSSGGSVSVGRGGFGSSGSSSSS